METYFFLFIFVWLIALSIVVVRSANHYRNLVSSTRKKKLDEILDQLISNNSGFAKQIGGIEAELKKINDQAKYYFKKAGLVRYDPFEGRGEQSFVLALLDSENSGIILNFIYTRDGLRVYTKRVKNNQGEKYQLSEEEKQAIEKSDIRH